MTTNFAGEREEECESTDVKLATLASLHPDMDQNTLLDILVASDGSVDAVNETLSCYNTQLSSRKKVKTSVVHQTSLASFRSSSRTAGDGNEPQASKLLTRKGQTLHLYSPEDIELHTPCSIIHNFLPAQEAEDLLKELLEEATTFERQTFKVFDNVVQSPHSACFYVDSLEEKKIQQTEYLYNGSFLTVCQKE